MIIHSIFHNNYTIEYYSRLSQFNNAKIINAFVYNVCCFFSCGKSDKN